MNCPACRAPLIAVEYEAIEVDYCVDCKGVWLDAGELELLLGNQRACSEFLAGGDAAPLGEQRRKCPICRKNMEKHQTRGTEPVVYDRCGGEHGLWLDDGELAQIMRQAPALAGGETVRRFLRELFDNTGEGE